MYRPSLQLSKEIMSKSIMLDNETLGTTADAMILSIGAVKFDPVTGKIDDNGFYVSISVDSNFAFGRRISEDTLIWWLKQPAAAQQVFFEPKETLDNALLLLSDWIGTGDYEVWSKGADFDIPMLAHAYTQCGIEIPWKFWNARCFRTWSKLPGAGSVTVPTAGGVKHNALADAVHQAQHASAIYQELFAAKKPKVKA